MAIANGTYTHASAGAGTGPFTFNHTASSSSGGTILFVTCSISDSQTVTGVTYNGVAMVFVGARNAPSATDGRSEMWRMYNPPSGSHTVSISVSGSTSIEMAAMDYTDSAAAGTGIDKVNTFTSATTALSETLTPTLTGMWMITSTDTGGGADATATTNCIRRSGVSAQRDMGVFDNDTNGLTGSSAFTMTQTAGGTTSAMVSCTFDIPSSSAPATTASPHKSLLGVGI